jgi:hypothetical protein
MFILPSLSGTSGNGIGRVPRRYGNHGLQYSCEVLQILPNMHLLKKFYATVALGSEQHCFEVR